MLKKKKTVTAGLQASQDSTWGKDNFRLAQVAVGRIQFLTG